MEDSSCRASDSSNSLRAGALGDGDPGTALQVWDKHCAARIFPTVVEGAAPPTRPQPGNYRSSGHSFITGGVGHLPDPQHQGPRLLP